MDWAMFGAIGALFIGVIGIQTALLLWMMNKMDNDIRVVAADSNAKWMAANSRSDTLLQTLSARIDTTNEIIIKLLDKK